MAKITIFNTAGSRYGISISGIEAFDAIDDVAQHHLVSAQRAVNKALDWTRTRSAEAIRSQVAFPASYLNPAEGRLIVKAYASTASLSGRIGARVDPTSLARFVKGNPKPGAPGGVTVEIKPGRAVVMPKAFLVRLANANMGLAVRSKGPPAGAYLPKAFSNGLWLLYGPSISQVFDGTRAEVAPAAAEFLEQEYNRQMDLKQ